MAVQSKLRGGDRIPAASPAQIPCLLGTCPLGVIGQPYTFNPGDDVVGTLGGGKLAQAVLYLHATTGSAVVAVPSAGTYPGLPSVTSTGGGPTVTVGLTQGNPVGGAYDHLKLLLAITIAGAGGVAQGTLCYDGVQVAETRTIPAQGPAPLLGAALLTPTTLALASGLTLVFDAPSSATITLASPSLAAAPAGLMAATATVGAGASYTTASYLAPGVAAILANPRKIKFTTAGVTPAHVPASVSVTGFDYAGNAISETVTPSTTAGSVETTKVYASFSWSYTSAGGTDATLAVGYDTAYASVAELVAEVNTLLAAAPLAVVASNVQTALGSYLGLATTGVGTGVSLTLDASPGTGAALLGFTANQTATGSAATMPLPFTGATLTFASGNYPLNATYSIPLSGPSTSVANLVAAATAAHDHYATNPFGFLVTVEDFPDQTTAAAALTALTALTTTWLADPAAPIYVDVIVGTAFHVASAVKATNDANIATNDAAFVAAFPPSTPDSNLNSVAHDDVYIPGAQGLPVGTFRRSAAWCGASKRAGAVKPAANPADGGIDGATLLGPDGLTRARNENTATTKLGGLGGSGAWVLKSTSAGLAAPAFEVCASRAGTSSRLRDPGAVAIGLEILRLTFAEVEVWNGQTWEGDAANPVAASITETEPRAHHLDQLLGAVLRPGDYAPAATAQNGAAPNNVTAFNVIVTAPTLGNDGKVSVAVPFNPLGVVGLVLLNVTATGASITSAGT